MWGETPLPSITIFTNGFNLPYIPLKQNLTYNAVAWLGGVWESQVKLNFDLVVTCRDVVGDAVAGALLLHLLGRHCHRRSHRSAAPSGNLQ